MKAAIYLRVSTEEQANPDEHHSLPAQERACRALAAARGWDVTLVYADEGASASKRDLRKRPFFRAFLEDAEAGRFDVGIVHKLDRFARNLPAALDAFTRLQVANVALVSVGENLDFSTPAGRLLLHNILAVSQFFSENLADETRKGWNERGQKGYWRGDPPFGYCRGQCSTCTEPNGPRCPRYQGIDPLGPARELYPHPWEASGVALAFQFWVDQATCYRDVAEALNAAGYRTHNKRSGPGLFPGDALRLILTNPFYLGQVRVRDRTRGGRHYNVAPGRHPELITPELWALAQAKAATIFAHAPRRPLCAQRPYPLAGVLRCSRCGALLRGQADSHGVRRYCCARRDEFGADPATGGCDMPGLRADECEAQVLALLEGMAIPPADREMIEEALHAPARPDAPSTAALQEKLERLTWLYQEGDIVQEEYRRRKLMLQADLERARPPAQGEVLRAVDLLQSIGSAWRTATNWKTQNGLLRALFDGIWMADPAREPRIDAVRPQPAVLPYWSLLERTYGVEGIRTGMFRLPPLR
jgi:site-specific DNA recombinase